MASKEWFESWFDSPLYEKLYFYRDDSEAERLVSWIAGRFPPDRLPRVLDMGCGRGRHAILLAQEGYRVTGVDLSKQAILKAKIRAQRAGVSGVSWQNGDMRTWQDGLFDLVCNLFTSFGYFDSHTDNIRVIENMAAHIRSGGYLLMDYLNPQHVRDYLVPEELLEVEDMRCCITRAIEGDTIIKTITFEDGNNSHARNNDGETGKQFRYQERVKLYEKEWFFKVFKETGLSDYECFGDYMGGDYDPAKSPRLILQAKK